ncbi:hypothetical protein HaLaN_09323 [Haematococcus lacustris]|uniref:Uncharacterized protein n=1 Tax=Haematococcus lacustris TaxID=44745 RepID=A0A699YTA1_HAELA|nr:hypothetical protein HaLaN_09323 [Haematococcus lacustris]
MPSILALLLVPLVLRCAHGQPVNTSAALDHGVIGVNSSSLPSPESAVANVTSDTPLLGGNDTMDKLATTPNNTTQTDVLATITSSSQQDLLGYDNGKPCAYKSAVYGTARYYNGYVRQPPADTAASPAGTANSINTVRNTTSAVPANSSMAVVTSSWDAAPVCPQALTDFNHQLDASGACSRDASGDGMAQAPASMWGAKASFQRAGPCQYQLACHRFLRHLQRHLPQPTPPHRCPVQHLRHELSGYAVCTLPSLSHIGARF